jgi:serine/threonine-protein kinase
VAVPFGKYLLQRKIAEGGMAEIFLAQQPGIEGFARKVVVKRLLPDLSAESDFVRMFLNEARLAARLNHPNVVQIFELGQEDGAYYLAMEFIPGEDLRSVAQQADSLGKRPSLGLVCRILIEVLAGLHYAHTRTGPDGKPLGLVHRDISPQNVLVTYDGSVKIIDFGIAKATQRQQQDQTQAGLLKGKYAYMSPEQTRSGQIDARSDVFSAGILLWELLTWRRLFKRATDLATLVAVSDEPAPRVALLNPEVPEELDNITLRALAIDPDARFASAQEFQAALEECVANQGWEADNRALRSYMHELFRDKLNAQQAEEAQEMGVPERLRPGEGNSGRRGLPLMTMPLQTLDPAVRASLMPPAKQPAPQPRPRKPAPQAVSPQAVSPQAVSPQTRPVPVKQPAPVLAAPQPSAPPSASAVTPVRPELSAPQRKEAPAPSWPRRRILLAAILGLLLGFVVVALLLILGDRQ